MLLLSGCWFLDLSLDYLFSNCPSVGVSDFKEAVSRSRPAVAVSLIRPQTSALHTEWKVCGDLFGHVGTKLGLRGYFLFGSNTRRYRRHHAIRHGVRIGSNLRESLFPVVSHVRKPGSPSLRFGGRPRAASAFSMLLYQTPIFIILCASEALHLSDGLIQRLYTDVLNPASWPGNSTIGRSV